MENPVSQVLTIVVSEPTDKADLSKIDSYRVSFDNETVDTTVKEGNLDKTSDQADIKASLIGVAGGVDKTVVNSGVIYTVKKPMERLSLVMKVMKLHLLQEQ